MCPERGVSKAPTASPYHDIAPKRTLEYLSPFAEGREIRHQWLRIEVDGQLDEVRKRHLSRSHFNIWGYGSPTKSTDPFGS
jgi:hypothetical protein